ncbi:MAG: 4Fe-4S dicluster domain-containing protein [Thermodesulfovibrionales bacterium]|nr:4Fe-4S dicluster domain-containing protein [Thermodesulfovibrionales bacterium]
MSTETVKFEPEYAQPLLQEIMDRSGQNLLACYQCRRCAAGCPVSDEAGVTPDRLIRMIVFGQKEEALKNFLVWRCVACYTCGERCPNNIQTARITETLKQISKKANLEPLVPKVAAFHDSFLKSATNNGRLSEMEFMILLLKKIKNAGGWSAVIAEMKSQSKLGKALYKKKRIHFGSEKVKNLSEIKKLVKKAEAFS